MKEYGIRYFHVITNNIIRASQSAKKESNVSDREIRAFFVTSLKTCASLWKICDFPNKTRPKHMMWGLMFLKSYDSEIKLASLSGVSAKTFRKWNWIIISEIGKKMHKVVSFDYILTFVIE